MLMKIIRQAAVLGFLAFGWLNSSPLLAQSAFIQIDHGGNIVCVLRDDNAAFCNATFNVNARTPADLPPVDIISTGPNTACTLLTSGDLRCFGSEGFGLSNPPTGGAPYKDVSIANSHACAINNLNGLECWGIDTNNRLAAPDGEFTQVSVSFQSACAVDVNGGVSCWGANDQGTADVPADLPQAKKVVSGFASSCALLADDSIQCWGRPMETLTGSYIDFDMLASGNYEQGNSTLCATDLEGVIDCRFIQNRSGSITEVTNTGVPVPQSTGNSSVTLTRLGGGCFINREGQGECFGFTQGTLIPPLDDNAAVPDTTGFRASVYSGTIIELFWDAPNDAFNVAGHEVIRNGDVIEFTPNLSSLVIYDLVPGNAETFAVRRVNVGGDRGEFSETISVTAQFGEQPDTPPNPDTYSPPQRQFEDSFLDAFVFCSEPFADIFWFSDTPTADIDGFELYRDGEFIAFVQGEFYEDFDITQGVKHLYSVIAIDLDEPDRFHGMASFELQIIDEEIDPELCAGF